MKKNLLIVNVAIVLIFLVASNIPAQTAPERIDVVSLQVSYVNLIDPEVKIIYRNSAQSLITGYGFIADTVPYHGTYPLGTILNSNSFGNFGSVEVGTNFFFRFTLTSSESDPIVLRPTILRKKRFFILRGSTVLRGKMEIIDRRPNPDQIIAVDEDFELSGNYAAEFYQSRNGNQRTATYSSLIYALDTTY